MHLLAVQSGKIEEAAIDLEQPPGDIVILSAADTELAGLASAYRRLAAPKPALRLANLTRLNHPYSVDLYVEKTLATARIIVVRILGGLAYWRYGAEEVARLAENGTKVIFLSGDDRPDNELTRLSKNLSPDKYAGYFREGGDENYTRLLKALFQELDEGGEIEPPLPVPRFGLYNEDVVVNDHKQSRRPVAAIIFYRALLQSHSLEAVDMLIAALDRQGFLSLPIFVQSLKEKPAMEFLCVQYDRFSPSVTLNMLSFALNDLLPGDAPILQVVQSGESEAEWRAGKRGLTPRDLAMQVALPEIDGKILTRAVSFKSEAIFDAETCCDIIKPRALQDRADFIARQAKGWVALRAAKPSEKVIGIVLANYPNRDGRIGNGVGLDVPNSLIRVLNLLDTHGYDCGDIPKSTKQLMRRMSDGPTNASAGARSAHVLPLEDYRVFFRHLPSELQAEVSARWGHEEQDPFFRDGGFHLALHSFGKMLVGIQPARGYHIDPVQTYHDPELAPPHYYLAFYFYVGRDAQAVIHLGKHGTLEWMPGKALALGKTCWPEAIFGTVPHLYPFIVNDPGEGTQAKRRTSAVILDHLTPPLTRGETYGDLSELERLVDEYYEAAQLDPRRLEDIGNRILERVKILGLDKDCGINDKDTEKQALLKLDHHLCELKELQIRDGLHIYGQLTTDLTDLLIALARYPRGKGESGDQSLLRALAKDLELEFDPLKVELAAPWHGPYPPELEAYGSKWRNQGDVIERLEGLARSIIGGSIEVASHWHHTRPVIDFVETRLRVLLQDSAAKENQSLLCALEGKFISPGPAGAPTRGRLDVFPTGRNFYSVDTRAVPTPSAWTLGWKSAMQLIDHHKSIHGEWPRSFVLSVWGTSNMRTGGDDIAQALALLGVKPQWDETGRVVGFDILPLSVLDRPRIDVTLRISGFFRDAFPMQIDLFDSAARAVGALQEPFDLNPIAAQMQQDKERLCADGVPDQIASLRAGHRIYGARPGAYGTGLQAMIDEGLFQTHDDLGEMFINWGSYAYGVGVEGQHQPAQFSKLLSNVDAVLHNQDNREHDILDSDDYYQFEGGLTAAVRHLTGRIPAIWHNDHSNIDTPKSRPFQAELGRILRGRATNPKWIKGVMRHGYKGASEMAATVDYLYAFAATTGLVQDQHFTALFEAYLGDSEVRDFIAEHNPAALREMAARFKEAIERRLWRPGSNYIPEQLEGWMT